MSNTNRFSAAARRASATTNQQLAGRIQSLSEISEERLQELLPEARDREEFAALIREVEVEASTDLKLAKLRSNVTTAGKIAFDLVKGMI